VQDHPALFILEDRHATDYTAPVLDARQDKTLLWARQAGGVTSFAFTMPVRNCRDMEQDVTIPKDRFLRLAYAYGDNEVAVRDGQRIQTGTCCDHSRQFYFCYMSGACARKPLATTGVAIAAQ
jgi:hypothetical protein